MKKLIPMMAVAAVAFGAFADKTPIKSQGFEGATAGAVTDLDALTKGDTDLVWKTDDTGATLTVSAYDAEKETPYTYGTQDKYFGDTNTQKLEIDSSKPVYAGYGASTDILADGTYIDTLVKFTVTDQDTAVETDTNAKLAIWAQATNAEGTENVLKVMCGQLEGAVLNTQVLDLNKANIDPAQWYRLTVRTADSGEKDDGTMIAGFEIYVDGVKLAAGEQDTFLACIAGSTIEGVGFKGNGAVDDVAITDNENAPSFAIPPVVDVDITWNKDEVTALTVNGTVVADVSAGTIKATPDKDGNISVTGIEFAEGYMGAAEQTLTAENPAVVAVAVAFTDADGKNKYADLKSALAAGGKLILKSNVTETLKNYIEVNNATTIDLAGNNLTLKGSEEVVFYVNAGVSLTVIDSVGTGVVTSSMPMFYSEGTNTIGAAEGDKGATFVGQLVSEGSNTKIVKGKFDRESNAKNRIEGMLADQTLEAVVDGDYIVVQAKGEPEVEVTVSVTKTGATATVSVADGAKVKAGDVITVTDVAAAADYKNATVTINGEAVTEYTVTGEEESIAIVVSATAITYATVTINTVDNCTITVKNGETAVETGAKFDVDDEVVLTVTRVAAEGYELDNCAAEETVTMTDDQTITAAVKAAAQPLPGDDYMAEGEKTAYDEWAKATGVTAEDTALAADLAVAFRLNVTGTETPADAIAAADAKATDLVKKIDLAKLAAGEDALAAVKAELPAGLQAVLKPVEKTEIDTTASLFRLVIEPVNAN